MSSRNVPSEVSKYEEMLEPKLVPINLWALVPAYIFEERRNMNTKTKCCGRGCGTGCVNPDAPVDFDVYGRSGCKPCDQLKALLARKGKTFHYFNVEEDPAAMSLIRSHGIASVPAIFQNGEFVGYYFDMLDLLNGSDNPKMESL